MTISADVQAIEKKAGVFLTAHHLVLYVALAVALSVGTYLVESKWAAVETARANASQQALAVEKDHSAQLEALYKDAQAQRDRDNAAALATISQIKSQTQVQIVHDKALPAPDLGHRIETITGFKQGTITLDSTQDLIVPLPLAQEIAVRLDQSLADAATVVQQSTIIGNQSKTISDLTAIVASDKVVLAGQIKADGDELSKVKADCRKSKWRWLGVGVGIGVAITGRVLGKF